MLVGVALQRVLQLQLVVVDCVVRTGRRRQQHRSYQRVLSLQLRLTAVGWSQLRRDGLTRLRLVRSVCSSSLPLPRVELGASLGAGVHEGWGQRPVISLARRVGLVSGHFHEALVQREVVADGVLPSATVVSVEGEIVHDVVVYLIQCQLLLWGALDRHGDEGDVGKWRSLVNFHQFFSAVAHDAC